MKRCPKCNHEYPDPTLEFCLEDGSRLISQALTKTSEETVVLGNLQTNLKSPLSPLTDSSTEPPKSVKVQELKEKAVDQGYKILEVTPIVFALIHNYWQWLFADKQNYHSFTEYFLSSSFIFWFLLLIFSCVLSIITLKFGREKKFAITSLIILAINLLLFIVPRR
jgi:magnesium-transporting ATPase (P-type)